MRQWLMVDEIIEMAILMISQHPLFKDPIVLSPKTGRPIRITKLRTKDGFDLNETGLTLSIFPYSYQGTSNETVTSNNAAMVFEPFTVGSGSFQGFDRCKLALVVKLQTTGIEDDITPSNSTTGMPVIERSLRERYLYRWLTILRTILLTKPIADLGGLVKNSGVNWGSFRSTDWTGQKGQNYVLHSAALLWQLEINVPRNWEMIPERSVWDNTSIPSWTYVGVRAIDEVLVYWESNYKYLVSPLGFPILTTPKGERVVWDLTEKRFESPDGVAFTETQLQDPRRNPIGPWILTNLIFTGVVSPLNKNVYFNTTTNKLQLFDGTIISTTSDGRPITWDTVNKRIIYADTLVPVLSSSGTSGPTATTTVSTGDSPATTPSSESYLPGTVVEGITSTAGDAPVVTSPSDLVTSLPPELAPPGTLTPSGTLASSSDSSSSSSPTISLSSSPSSSPTISPSSSPGSSPGSSPSLDSSSSSSSMPGSGTTLFLPGSGSVSTSLDPTTSSPTGTVTPSGTGTPAGISILIPGITTPVYLIPFTTKAVFTIYEANRLELRDTFEL